MTDKPRPAQNTMSEPLTDIELADTFFSHAVGQRRGVAAA